MAHAQMLHERDPQEVILDEIGDISDFEIANNQVLLAVYERPEKTKGGFILTDKTLGEDKYQSKVGLIVKMGPDAFVETEKWHFNLRFSMNDWAVFRPSDGWTVTVNGKICRMFDDTDLKGRVSHPDMIW